MPVGTVGGGGRCVRRVCQSLAGDGAEEGGGIGSGRVRRRRLGGSPAPGPDVDSTPGAGERQLPGRAWTLLGAGLGAQQSSDLRTSLLAGASGSLVVSGAAAVWTFLAILVLTRALGAHGYGAYAYALAWATVLAVPASAGLPKLVTREAARAAADQGDVVNGLLRRSFQAVVVASAVVVAVGGAAALGLSDDDRDARLALLLGLGLVPLVASYRIAEAALRGFRRSVEGRIAETTVQPLVLIALVLVVSATSGRRFSPVLAMGLTLAAAAVAVVTSLVLLGRLTPPEVRRAQPRYNGRAWARGARPLLLASAAQTVQAQAALILLGLLGELRSTGAFSVALRWAAFVTFARFVVDLPLAPAIARLHAQGDRRRLQLLLRRATAVVTAFAAVVAIGLAVAGEWALRLFGDGFGWALVPLLILVVGEVVTVACGSVGLSLTMTGHEGAVARAQVVAVVVLVALGLALIPALGANGAAVAHAVSSAALNVVLAVHLWRREGVYAPVLGRRAFERFTPATVGGSGRVPV